MYFLKWKKEGSKMLPDKNDGASSDNMESVEHIDMKDKEIPTAPFNSQREQEKDDLTVIDYMTLEDTLKILKSDSLLSDLDDDLKNVKEGRETMEDHKEYFKTQVDKKLKQLCFMYSPNSPKWHSIPEEERPKAQAMQVKLNDIRSILKHFNENFSQYDDFKYSYFSKVRVDLLGNEETLKKTSHAVLNTLGELSYIKYERLVPNLNGFLRSSQASIKGFISNNVNHFQKEKDNAECYFQSYLIGYGELRTNLELFCKLCKQDARMEPIATQMLEECKTQGKILTRANDFLNQSQVLINSGHLINCKYPYCINDKRSYEQAEKNFTLPFIEYINILAICNEICLNRKVPLWKKAVGIIPGVNYFISNEATHKIVADNEIIKNSNDLLSLHKIAHYLLTYYCYRNEENGKLAAEFLRIDSLNSEYALALLVQVINSYSNYLEKEFKPEKDFYEKIAEVQMEFLKTMKSLCDEFCKKLEQYHEQFFEADLELHKANLELHKQIHKQDSEFYQLASEFLTKYLEREEADIVKMEEKINKEVPENIEEEQQNKLSCSSSSQQSLQTKQPGPSSKLGEVPPMLRSQSLNSLHSDNSDIEVINKSQCR
ncbi:MAG: hypothetical protein ACR5K5_04215 [Wolbachia sp.]